ncbi:MAG: MarR family winged helix-turn-helix transcriptional regulator [Paracoccaceae bacterium]
MDQRQIDSFYPLTQTVRRLFHKLGHGASALHRDMDVSAGMRAVLESVINGGPQTVPQMARVRPVSRQHIQGLVNALFDLDYVEYADNPAHKRSKLVAPTSRGHEVFAAMRARENAAFRRIRVDCSAEELAAANLVLRKLIATFDGPEWRAIVGENETKTEE